MSKFVTINFNCQNAVILLQSILTAKMQWQYSDILALQTGNEVPNVFPVLRWNSQTQDFPGQPCSNYSYSQNWSKKHSMLTHINSQHFAIGSENLLGCTGTSLELLSWAAMPSGSIESGRAGAGTIKQKHVSAMLLSNAVTIIQPVTTTNNNSVTKEKSCTHTHTQPFYCSSGICLGPPG